LAKYAVWLYFPRCLHVEGPIADLYAHLDPQVSQLTPNRQIPTPKVSDSAPNRGRHECLACQHAADGGQQISNESLLHDEADVAKRHRPLQELAVAHVGHEDDLGSWTVF